MNRLAVAPVLVLGARRMMIEKPHGLRFERPGTDVPEQHCDRGDHDTPSNSARGARDHVRQSTDRSPALST